MEGIFALAKASSVFDKYFSLLNVMMTGSHL
jgi:hypothetical protein